jgi:hypothetical protein
MRICGKPFAHNRAQLHPVSLKHGRAILQGVVCNQSINID